MDEVPQSFCGYPTAALQEEALQANALANPREGDVSDASLAQEKRAKGEEVRKVTECEVSDARAAAHIQNLPADSRIQHKVQKRSTKN